MMSSSLPIVKDELLEAWIAPINGREYRKLFGVQLFTNQAYLKQLGRGG